MEEEIRNTLEILGYEVSIEPKGFRCAANFRNGENKTSLLVYRDNGNFIDFARGTKGSFKQLIKLTLGLETEEQLEQWLQTKNIVLKHEIKPPRIKMLKIYPIELLKQLAPVHDYWIKRGIDLETLKLFRGGLAGAKGSLSYRYIFPVFNAKNEIIGFCGRDILPYKNEQRPKWKIINSKLDFKYPLFLNREILKKEKKVVLVESIGDVLSCWVANVYNVVCLFGVDLSNSLLTLFIKYDMQKIIISTNNDSLNNKEAGNLAAEKIKNKLLNYFDESQVIIALPEVKKDFNETLQLENGRKLIKEWYERHKN